MELTYPTETTLIKVETPTTETEGKQSLYIPSFNPKHFNSGQDDEEEDARFKKKRKGLGR